MRIKDVIQLDHLPEDIDREGLIAHLDEQIEKRLGPVDHLVFIPEGNNHLVFEVHLTNGTLAIARVQLQNQRENALLVKQSIEQEELLFGVFAQSGARVPEVYALVKDETFGEFLLVEFLPGLHFSDWMAQKDNRMDEYLQFMENYGEQLAKIHSIKQSHFGTIKAKAEQAERTTIAYHDKLRSMVDEQLSIPKLLETFGDDFIERFNKFIGELFSRLENPEWLDLFKPCLTLVDHHPHNVLISDTRELGFFDLENAVANTPVSDIALTRAQFCGYFYEDENAIRLAEESLIKGYLEAGGDEAVFGEAFKVAELIYVASLILGVVMSYKDSQDDYNKNWSQEFSQLLEKIIETKEFNPADYARIISSKTKQPSMTK